MDDGEKKPTSELVVYSSSELTATIDMPFDGETLWLTLSQIADLFSTTADNVRQHIKKIYADGEADVSSTSKKIYGVVDN